MSYAAEPAEHRTRSAQRSDDSDDSSAPDRDTASITFSPQHLLASFIPYERIYYWFEVTGEFRVADGWAASAVGGLQKQRLTGSVEQLYIVQVGAKGHWYPLGHFNNGMQLGVETIYRAPTAHRHNLDVRRQTDVPILLAGPYIGYKYVNDPGWTVEVQGGANYPFLRDPEAKNEAHHRPTRVRLLVNFGLGWSF